MKKVVIGLVVAMSVWGASYSVGQSLSSLDLPDQFGKHHSIKAMPTLLIIAFEKGTAATVNDCLGKEKSDYLSSHKALYIADISKMPSFIAKVFALPKMEKYPYTVLLIQDEEQGAKFPAKEEKITLIHLEGNTIKKIDYLSSANELKQAIEK